MTGQPDIHQDPLGVQAFDVTPEPEPKAEPQQEPQAEPQAEPQQPNTYETIIKQQNEQIDLLIEHTERLNAQIAQMVQGGVQFTDNSGTANGHTRTTPNPMQQMNPPALTDNDDFSLEALGREIGKPRHE